LDSVAIQLYTGECTPSVDHTLGRNLNWIKSEI